MPSSLGRTLLIANPAAQRGNGAKAAEIARELLAQWLGEELLECALTERAKHAIDIAAKVSAERFDTVIALGGDGIVHEVVNGLMTLPADNRPRFGLIPVGSGNDYARTLGMAESVPDAVVQFLDAHETAFDVGCCNGEYFAETLSFGLDAAIALDTVKRRERTGEQGTILYLKSGLDQLLHHLETYEFTAVLDGGNDDETHNRNAAASDASSHSGEPQQGTVSAPQGTASAPQGTASAPQGKASAPQGKASAPQGKASTPQSPGRTLKGSMHMFAIQVGPTYGGGFRICPEADPTDGLLDICYAEAPMSVVEATFKFLRAKDAHHTKFKDIHFERAANIQLSFDKRPACQLDGEPHIADSYSISLESHALRVLVAS